MKSSPSLHRFVSLATIAFAGSVLAPVAHAQNLAHNLSSTLTLTGDVSYASVLVGVNGGSTSTIVDATGTDSFTSNGTQFFVGAHSSNTSIGTLNLGILNNITANQVTIGGLEPDANNQTGHAGRVTTLANGTTTINATNMAVGTGKGNASISGQTGGRFILGSDATLNLYGLTGSNSRASLVVGRWASFNAHSGNGGVDLSAGIANLHLSELAVGNVTSSSGGSGNTTTGVMTLGTSASNHLNVSGAGSVVKVGFNNQSGGNAITSNGTLTIGNLNSTSSITSTDNSTAVLVGFRGGSGQTANGTLNFNGGTLTITTTGAAIAGAAGSAGSGTSTLNLSGGAKLIAGASSTDWIHSLTTAAIGSGGATIDTNGFDLGVSQAFSGAGGLTKDGAGTLTLSGNNSYSGSTHVEAGTLVIDGASTLTNVLAVAADARLGGNGNTSAAVTVEAGGKWLVDISDWTGDAGIGFTDLSVATLTLDGAWVVDVTSLTSYDNFTEANASFPFLTVTTPDGISGFNPANVSVTTGSFSGTGTWSVAQDGDSLELVYTAGGGSDYAAWDAQYPDADLSDPDGDFDGDGLSNFYEYAFGLDPTSGASVKPITDISELQADGIFSYTRRANSGLSYTYWISTDLQDWGDEPVEALLEEAGEIDDDGVQTVVVVLDLPESDKVFLRVKAE